MNAAHFHWRRRGPAHRDGLLFTRLGQVFIPTLDEKNIAMNARRIPSTSLSQSQAMQLIVERTIRKFPQVAVVFSKTGTAEVAMDPMPPNFSDTFIMLKPKEDWPDPELTKDELQRQIEEAVRALAGNTYEFTQPIQMRFNELIAGVRGSRHQSLWRRVQPDAQSSKPNGH